MARRKLPALVNGPYSLTPRRRGVRVNSTRGKFSRIRICRYGNDLSSFSSTLNRGWMSLTSRASSSRASTSLSAGRKSMSSMSLTRSAVRGSSAAALAVLHQVDAGRGRELLDLLAGRQGVRLGGRRGARHETLLGVATLMVGAGRGEGNRPVSAARSGPCRPTAGGPRG